MTKKNAVESCQPDLQEIKLRTAYARLPGERRNLVARKALLRLIRCEFEEMPRLSLTHVQASVLFGISLETSVRILLGLTEQGLLRLRKDGHYVLGSSRSQR